MKQLKQKKIILILVVTLVLTVAVFLMENVFDAFEPIVTRNAYGEGKKTEEYELRIEKEDTKQKIEVEVKEQEYTHDEIQKMFAKIDKKLDAIVLGDNKSWDRVERNLNFVTEMEEYPVRIAWELSSYTAMSPDGILNEEKISADGTLVEIRGIITYGDEEMIYIRNARLYPRTRKGTEKLVYEIQQELKKREGSTRQSKSFKLPEEVAGVKLQWSQKKGQSWYYILIFGVVVCAYILYHEREKVKKKEKQRSEELLRDYPGMISKFTMLLSTGATVKSAWERIVQNYEKQKEQLGRHVVYEEMKITIREMQSGVSEAEAYENFGKRCGLTMYMKFGTLLAQNLRKGSKGISEILRVEAIQAFENRKSTAKRLGEEAGAKLMMPMLGMLAVVLVMVMVPAFLSMRL